MYLCIPCKHTWSKEKDGQLSWKTVSVINETTKINPFKAHTATSRLLKKAKTLQAPLHSTLTLYSCTCTNLKKTAEADEEHDHRLHHVTHHACSPHHPRRYSCHYSSHDIPMWKCSIGMRGTRNRSSHSRALGTQSFSYLFRSRFVFLVERVLNICSISSTCYLSEKMTW